ncbi:MAG: flagellar basal body-associated FliL family protein [Acetobacteraceae bacterium]
MAKTAATKAVKAEPAEADAPAAADGSAAPAPARRDRRKLIMLTLPAVLMLLGAGLWFAGVPAMLFGAKPHAKQVAASAPPVYVDLPEMVANLDSDPRRPRYIKLRARIEVRAGPDAKAVQAAMPRLQDLFQTYLRDLRPDDLRGSAGTYRLREELIARADVAAAPAHIADVLFVEMLVQ